MRKASTASPPGLAQMKLSWPPFQLLETNNQSTASRTPGSSHPGPTRNGMKKPSRTGMRYSVALYEEPTKAFGDYLSHGADGSGKDMGAARGAPAGTFTLEAVEVSTRRTAWRATTPDVIQHGPSAEQVPRAVRQMIESFPHRD